MYSCGQESPSFFVFVFFYICFLFFYIAVHRINRASCTMAVKNRFVSVSFFVFAWHRALWCKTMVKTRFCFYFFPCFCFGSFFCEAIVSRHFFCSFFWQPYYNVRGWLVGWLVILWLIFVCLSVYFVRAILLVFFTSRPFLFCLFRLLFLYMTSWNFLFRLLFFFFFVCFDGHQKTHNFPYMFSTRFGPIYYSMCPLVIAHCCLV